MIARRAGWWPLIDDRDGDDRDAEQLADPVELALQRRRRRPPSPASEPAILPSSVAGPVAVTIGPAAPGRDRRPAEDHVARGRAMPTSSSSGVARPWRPGVLSPVRAASATRSAIDSSTRASAGTVSPSSSSRTSPGTSSPVGTVRCRPSRSTRAVGRGHRLERRHRLLGAALLDEPEHAVQDHDREDGERLVRDRRLALESPGDERDDRRDEQQDRQRSRGTGRGSGARPGSAARSAARSCRGAAGGRGSHRTGGRASRRCRGRRSRPLRRGDIAARDLLDLARSAERPSGLPSSRRYRHVRRATVHSHSARQACP